MIDTTEQILRSKAKNHEFDLSPTFFGSHNHHNKYSTKDVSFTCASCSLYFCCVSFFFLRFLMFCAAYVMKFQNTCTTSKRLVSILVSNLIIFEYRKISLIIRKVFSYFFHSFNASIEANEAILMRDFDILSLYPTFHKCIYLLHPCAVK